jgi:hypothetical protein
LLIRTGVLAFAIVALATAAAAAPKPVMADDIPVAHTPQVPGGYGLSFPAPVLETCTEPLSKDAPDLRGVWRIIDVNGKPPAPSERLYHYAERIEQCGNRIIDMGGGTIADARADGTEKNADHDVSVRDFRTPITVIATFEAGVFVLRPAGQPGVEVRRWLDGQGHLVWTRPDYGRMTLERVAGPNAPYTRPD